MNLSPQLRLRISALGELSRPLGEARAAVLARDLATEVASEVACGRNPERTIDAWIRRIASEITNQHPAQDKKAHASGPKRTQRSLADVLPEIQ